MTIQVSSVYAYCFKVVWGTIHCVGQLLSTLLYYSCLVAEHVCADVLYIFILLVYLYLYLFDRMLPLLTHALVSVKLRPIINAGVKSWSMRFLHYQKAILHISERRNGSFLSEIVTFGCGILSELVVFCFFIQLTLQDAHFLTVGVTMERCQTNSKHMLHYILVKLFSLYFSWV